MSNFAKAYNDMKNYELAKDLQDFLDDRYAETDENKDRFTALLNVIVGRLKTLKSFAPAYAKKPYVRKTSFVKQEI